VGDGAREAAVTYRDLAARKGALLGQRLAGGGSLFVDGEDVDAQTVLHDFGPAKP
jgi:hypothetical protein